MPAANNTQTMESIGNVTGSSGRPGGGGFDEMAMSGISRIKNEAVFFMMEIKVSLGMV